MSAYALNLIYIFFITLIKTSSELKMNRMKSHDLWLLNSASIHLCLNGTAKKWHKVMVTLQRKMCMQL